MLKRFIFGLLNFYRKTRLFFIKLRGKTPDDIHEKRIVTGKAWAEFCDSLKATGASLVASGTPRDAFNQAEGHRYLTRLVRAGLEAFIEYADPAYPVLRRMVHETVKIGADNPDNYYQNAQISGEYEYKITGNRNTIFYLGFGTQKGNYGKTGGLQPSGYLESKDMIFEEDGSFEIILSKEKKGKNWLKMEEDTSMIIVRQTFLDRENEQIADMTITRIDGNAKPALVSPKLIDEGLTMASAFVAGTSMIFGRWAKGFQKHKNELPMFDPEVSNAAGGVDNITYYHSYWELAKDEALIIEVMPPNCTHWNFQLNNHWMESLDYRYFNIHINKHSAKYQTDGSIRIIVAHQDPKLDNWIDTVGHQQGTMCFRWVDAENKPQPQTRVMKFEDL